MIAPADESARRWDELHTSPSFAPRFPVDAAVRWLFRGFPRARASETKILDAGCGAGRHALLFAREGYRASACDFSQVGLDALAKSANAEGREIPTRVAEADALPYPDASFDGVLSWGVLYYMPLARYAAALGEIHRVLKPGGHALVMVKSNLDSRAITGEAVADHGYRVRNAPDGMSWGNEIGMVLTLLDRPTLASLARGFAEIRIESQRTTLEDGRYADDDWHAYLKR